MSTNVQTKPSIEHQADNWVMLSVGAAEHDVSEYGDHEFLSNHADLAGPAKFVHGPNGIEQRIDLCLSDQCGSAVDAILDEQAAAQQQTLHEETIGRASACLSGRPRLDDWSPPTAKVLMEWLVDDGRTAAIDEQGNLRMTLRAAESDGQVHVECAPTRLRFTMPLGQWPNPVRKAQSVMLGLASEANSRCRLVRVVWQRQENACRCEAQADLTFVLPTESDNMAAESMARGMILAAADGLELVLRQLQHALAVLGEGKQDELIEELFFDREE